MRIQCISSCVQYTRELILSLSYTRYHCNPGGIASYSPYTVYQSLSASLEQKDLILGFYGQLLQFDLHCAKKMR